MDNQKPKWSFKDKLEIMEAVFTIIVSIMAIWGTIIAWENGFWGKLKHVVDHAHEDIVKAKQDIIKIEKKEKL